VSQLQNPRNGSAGPQDGHRLIGLCNAAIGSGRCIVALKYCLSGWRCKAPQLKATPTSIANPNKTQEEPLMSLTPNREPHRSLAGPGGAESRVFYVQREIYYRKLRQRQDLDL
jgi:hypothetical protein